MGEAKRRKQLDDSWGKPNYALGQEYICEICNRRMFTYHVPYKVTVCGNCQFHQDNHTQKEIDKNGMEEKDNNGSEWNEREQKR
jgi:hypothetical protein